jgi:hypothetical protein
LQLKIWMIVYGAASVKSSSTIYIMSIQIISTNFFLIHFFNFNAINTCRIPTVIFQKVANEIPTIFKGELSSTYFTPYQPKTKTNPRVLYNGKLWNKAVNSRQKLKFIKDKVEEPTSNKGST